MVRLGSAPQQPDRSRPARSDRRRIPAKEPAGRTAGAGGISSSTRRSSPSSSPNACCRARPRASCSGPSRSWTPSAPAAWARSTRPSPRPTTTGTPSRCCRAAACGTSASPAARSAPSSSASTPPSCRSSTWAPPAACTTWPGRSSRAKSSARSSKSTARSRPTWPIHYALQIAEGLDVCHQQGLFHGLLKPSNIMIGSDNKVYILDFGIGSLAGRDRGRIAGRHHVDQQLGDQRPGFCRPESIMDPPNLTPAGDQYSLGCVLYYMPDGPAAVPGRQRGREDDGPSGARTRRRSAKSIPTCPPTWPRSSNGS